MKIFLLYYRQLIQLYQFSTHLQLNLKSKNKNLKISSLDKQDYIELNNYENIFNSIDRCKDFVGESIPITSKNKKLQINLALNLCFNKN